jgi:hypothetical protein
MTQNISFIKMYKILKRLGIKNNKFFLKLYDSSLLGVRVWITDKNGNIKENPNLTKEQKLRITTEVRRNPWYFFRECVVLPVAGGIKRFELHRGNLAMLFCILHNLNSITILPRQHGKTVSSICAFIWIYYYATENSNILFLNKEYVDSKRNLKTFKDIADLLPSFLKVKHKNDKDNIEQISNGTNGNTIRAMSTAITESEADKKGRGCTTPLQLWDEFAFLKYNDIMYNAAAPASSQAKLEAKNHNKIYGTTITTTPNNIDVPEGKYCHDTMIGNAATFEEAMYDWSMDEIQEYLYKKSKNNFLYIEFSYKQLGRSEAWFEQQCRELNNNLLKIKREILLEWTKATDTSVYSEEILEVIEKQLKEIKTRLCFRKFYFLNLYSDDIDFAKPYLISIDVSTGMELDASTICITDPMTFEVVAEMRENNINTDEFARVIYEIVARFFINSMVVIENNMVSENIIRYLMKSAISKNLYYEYKEKETQKIEEGKTELVFKKNKKKTRVYGIQTTKATRPLMFEILDETIAEEPEVLATKNIYTDVKHLERIKGRIDHAEGYHDDSLMAYLIGRYVLAYGKNLNKWFLPVKGKEYRERKQSIARVTNELKKANVNGKYEYHGLAEDIIEEENFMEMRKASNKGSRSRFYLGIANDDFKSKQDSFGRIGRDIM